MYTIGVTGGIASGKSLVSTMLGELGAHVVEADEIARRQASPGSPLLERLVGAFGDRILHDDLSLDRRALAAIAFSDGNALARLNEITHPPLTKAIGRRLAELLLEDPAGVAVVDAALLLDWELSAAVDMTVAVVAPRDVRVARMVAEGMTESEAAARLGSQRPDDWYASRTDVVIENDGTEDELRERVAGLWERVGEQRKGDAG